MKSFQHTIDDILSLLKERGYSEEALQAFPVPRSFKDRLSENFAVCVLNGIATNKEKGFTIPITGFFRDDKDAILVEIGFLYKPMNGDLSLNSVSGTLGALTATMSLKTPRDLPTAGELYHQLTQRAGVLKSDSSKLDHDTQSMVYESAMFNRYLLEEAGYLRPLHNPFKQDWFLKGFEDRLSHHLLHSHSGKTSSFVFPFSKCIEGENFRTYFRPLFQVDTSGPQLTSLRAIHAHTSAARVLLLIDSYGGIPPLSRLHNDLAADGIKKTAALMYPTIKPRRRHF